MKRILFKIISLVFFLPQISFADFNALFFNVASQGNALLITTAIPNKVYPEAGIRISTVGASIARPGVDCIPIDNGFCLFSVSDANQRTIAINGSAGTLSIRLCLNGRGPLSCQDYKVPFNPISACARLGGVNVSDDPTHSCWIKGFVQGGTVVKCSNICNGVGLTLQNPGPTNNSTLAGNVCSKYGFTDAPTETGGITIIDHNDNASPQSCEWNDINGTNWNNPGDAQPINNLQVLCPCVNPS